MATYTNIVTCNSANSNTGNVACSFDWGEISKIILVPKGYSMTQTEVQTLYATLTTKNAHATETSRSYPIGVFTGIEDKSSETSLNTTPYGGITLGKKGKFHFVFSYTNGGMNYDIMLNTFEDAQDSYDCFLVDKTANAIIGTKPDANTYYYVLKGFSLEQIYCPLPKLTSEAVTTHSIGLCFADTNEFMQNLAYYVLPSSQKVNSLVGLRNLELALAPFSGAFTGGTTSLKLRVTTDGGAVDVLPLYGSALAALYAQFTVTNNATGTALATPTAGSYASATNSLNITLGASSGTAGTEYTITSPSVTGLVAGLIPGFGNGTLVATTA
jgi:hypothetical protein